MEGLGGGGYFGLVSFAAVLSSCFLLRDQPKRASYNSLPTPFPPPPPHTHTQIVARGAPPQGGGEVLFRCANVKQLTPIDWLDQGKVKRIRGIVYSTRMSPQTANRVVDSARGLLNHFIPDVYIYTDHYKGAESGKCVSVCVPLRGRSGKCVSVCAFAWEERDVCVCVCLCGRGRWGC